jgi:hypothetical protein
MQTKQEQLDLIRIPVRNLAPASTHCAFIFSMDLQAVFF